MILLVNTDELSTGERAGIDRAIPMADEVVLASSRMSDNAITMIAMRRPTVAINRPMTDVPSLVSDNGRGMCVSRWAEGTTVEALSARPWCACAQRVPRPGTPGFGG